jgi:hypothetical protein
MIQTQADINGNEIVDRSSKDTEQLIYDTHITIT